MRRKHPFFSVLVVLLCGAALNGPLQAQTIWYVDDDAPGDPGPGNSALSDPLENGSALHPFDAIQEALVAAEDGDVVIAADGTYSGTGNVLLDFDGKAVSLRSQTGAQRCIIDCEGGESAFYFHSQEGAGTTLDGFTITRSGRIGILCEQSSPTVVNCTIANNFCAYLGGGILCNRLSRPLILNCDIVDNTAMDGAGIYCDDGSDALIVGCRIARNSALGDSGGFGCTRCAPTVMECEFVSNTALYGGGGARLGSTAVVSRCFFEGNSAGEGGAIASVGGTPLIKDCVIRGNEATSYGHALHLEGGVATVADCVISANGLERDEDDAVYVRDGAATIERCAITGNRGSGIYSRDATVTVFNCLIADNGNTALGGIGGVAGRGSDLTVTNCTILRNYAGSSGGGVFCTGSYAVVENCIVRGNTPTQVYPYSASTIIRRFSNIEGYNVGEGNIDVDPVFAFDDDPRLLPGSPCIDAGTNTPLSGLPDTDFDGDARISDGDQNGAATADMGAFEFAPDRPEVACAPYILLLEAYVDGPNPVEAVLKIRNSGGASDWYRVTGDSSWLTAPTGGFQLTGDIRMIQVRADVSRLTYGTHVGKLVFDDVGNPHFPRTIPVVLHVGRGYPTLQMRIDRAAAGETIALPDGVYAGPGNRDLNFDGKSITLRSANGPEHCIIDCERAGRGFLFDSDEQPDAVLEGVTIRNGRRNGPAIYCFNSRPTIRNCVLTGNASGCISCTGVNGPTILDCTIAGNYGNRSGVVLFSATTNAVMSDCRVENNVCMFEGGAVSCGYYSTPIIRNTIIANNRNVYGKPGGVDCGGDSAPLFEGCVIRDNECDEEGGGLRAKRSNPTILNCIIAGNTAFAGAGVSLEDCEKVEIVNSLIVGNRTEYDQGGGIDSQSSGLTIRNSTITDNYAHNYGGGLSVIGYRDVLVANCILRGNASRYDGRELTLGVSYAPGTVTLLYTDIATDDGAISILEGSELHWGPGNIDADPLFVDPPAFDYRLAAGSPCIDAACNCGVPRDTADLDQDGDTREHVPFDIEGEGRFFDDPDTLDTGSPTSLGAPVADLGAYEYGGSAPSPCRGDLNGDGHVDMEDLAGLLSAYGISSGALGPDGDMNCDGAVNLKDLAEFLGYYGSTCL